MVSLGARLSRWNLTIPLRLRTAVATSPSFGLAVSYGSAGQSTSSSQQDDQEVLEVVRQDVTVI
jgi:hypothetical protein